MAWVWFRVTAGLLWLTIAAGGQSVTEEPGLASKARSLLDRVQVSRSPKEQSALLREVKRLGKDAVPALRELLHGEDTYLAHEALQSLVCMRHPGATEAIIEHLVQVHPGTEKNTVLLAIGNHMDPRALSYVLPYAESSAADTRFAAAYALGGLGDPRALSHLERLRKDRDASTRWQARKSITEINRMQQKYPDRLRVFNKPLGPIRAASRD